MAESESWQHAQNPGGQSINVGSFSYDAPGESSNSGVSTGHNIAFSGGTINNIINACYYSDHWSFSRSGYLRGWYGADEIPPSSEFREWFSTNVPGASSQRTLRKPKHTYFFEKEILKGRTYTQQELVFDRFRFKLHGYNCEDLERLRDQGLHSQDVPKVLQSLKSIFSVDDETLEALKYCGVFGFRPYETKDTALLLKYAHGITDLVDLKNGIDGKGCFANLPSRARQLLPEAFSPERFGHEFDDKEEREKENDEEKATQSSNEKGPKSRPKRKNKPKGISWSPKPSMLAEEDQGLWDEANEVLQVAASNDILRLAPYHLWDLKGDDFDEANTKSIVQEYKTLFSLRQKRFRDHVRRRFGHEGVLRMARSIDDIQLKERYKGQMELLPIVVNEKGRFEDPMDDGYMRRFVAALIPPEPEQHVDVPEVPTSHSHCYPTPSFVPAQPYTFHNGPASQAMVHPWGLRNTVMVS